ncbi:tetratricopeptide repeat protein [Candidatus Omnitrophota bacterium]
MKLFLVIILVTMLVPLCGAQEKTEDLEHVSPKRLFSRGNDYYEKGEYQKAIDEYQKVISRGYESGPLCYNMGDAYFKSGKLGMAILNYERATYIMPRDADLKANYRFAREMVKGKPIKGKGIWQWRHIRMIITNFTINELTWLSSTMYILILILMSLAIVRPNMNRKLSIVAVICFLFMVFNIVVIWKKVGDMKTGAITIAREPDALFGPFDTATKFFTLYEGNPVNILKAKDDWYKVRRADGKIGWIKKNDVERIYTKGKSSGY